MGFTPTIELHYVTKRGGHVLEVGPPAKTFARLMSCFDRRLAATAFLKVPGLQKGDPKLSPKMIDLLIEAYRHGLNYSAGWCGDPARVHSKRVGIKRLSMATFRSLTRRRLIMVTRQSAHRCSEYGPTDVGKRLAMHHIHRDSDRRDLIVAAVWKRDDPYIDPETGHWSWWTWFACTDTFPVNIPEERKKTEATPFLDTKSLLNTED